MTGRPRDPATDAAIHQATLELVAEHGAGGVSMEGIAARAGVSKQAVYRRYRSKGEALLDAAATSGRALGVPDTGSLPGDLTDLLIESFERLAGPDGEVNRALMAQALHDPGFREQLWERHIQARRAALRGILGRARVRGEIDPAVPDDVLADLFFGAMWYRILFQHQPFDEAGARALADAVTRAARP
ncbi:TetR/AcrR family transcriptional regulator [Hamadaea tsunoensis]|uniref:TetR/AcrR family transcriptional regulator n=1 Tax=Hamadaea tsunoensis TaxID=53368 RepID=UPI00054E13BB|nr:TetR/AcrR family transcriptional regulator [Hamadaea tsunoensis]